MYKAFDKFLAVSTWHTQHPLDEKRFFVALSSVVKDSKFNPDAMGKYMQEKTRPPNVEGHPFDDAIAHYVAAAWAVKDYLAATGA
jgi:hypothetical protein